MVSVCRADTSLEKQSCRLDEKTQQEEIKVTAVCVCVKQRDSEIGKKTES